MKIFIPLALSISFLSVAGAAVKAPSYVVVGGGLSGLSAMDELLSRGHKDVELYEATARFGGRTWTEQGPPLYERGAELVNSTDTALIDLLKKYDIGLVHRRFHREHAQEMYVFRERIWSGGELSFGEPKSYRLTDLQLMMERNPKDRAALKRLAELQEKRIEKDAELRAMTALETVKDSDLVAAILGSLMRSELGVGMDEINAKTFIDCFEVDPKTLRLRLLPSADELYRIAGGSDALARSIERRHRSRMHLRSTVRSIKKKPDGRFELVIAQPKGVSRVVFADHVVLAVPAHALGKIRIEVPGLPAADLARAAEMPFARNTKVFLVFDAPFWREGKSSKWFQGQAFFENGIQMWETTEDQKTKKAVITLYPGGWPKDDKEGDEKMKALLREVRSVPEFKAFDKHLLKTDKQVWAQSYAGVFSPAYPAPPDIFGKNFGGLVFVGSDKDLNDDGSPAPSFAYMDGAVRSGRRGVEMLLKKNVIPAPDAVAAPAAAPL